MKIISLNKYNGSNTFKYFMEWLQDDLNSVNKVILDNLSNNSSLISEMSNYIISAGGKRIRPLITLGVTRLCNYSGNRHIGLAAVIEFIHTATLLHDDVIDNSKKRRGKKTANFVWDNKSSILVGDFFLSKAFRVLVNDGSLKCIDIISRVSEKIAFGEVKQLISVGNLKLSESDYLETISYKTAELFSAACQMASEISEIKEEQKKSLKDFGMFLGIAYQIVDDTLDYFSEEKKLGKELGNDFIENKITLPLILTYKRSNKKEKNFLEHLINKEKITKSDLSWVIQKMNHYDVLKDCIRKAKHFSTMAKDSLGSFSKNQAKDKLIELVDFLVLRKS